VSTAGLYHPNPEQIDLYKPMNILDKDTFFYLQALIGLVKPSLVVVDCFRELGSFKENVSEEQRPITNALRSLTSNHSTNPCACLLIHHTSKLSGKETTPDAKDAGRGSGYLSGAVDSIWFLHQQQIKIEARFAKKQTLYLNYDDTSLWSRR
jgi:RecA-family ATPase